LSALQIHHVTVIPSLQKTKYESNTPEENPQITQARGVFAACNGSPEVSLVRRNCGVHVIYLWTLFIVVLCSRN
jgi:hypothetical protein